MEKTLKRFSKDKRLGPNGWNVELYLHLFELLGKELVEEIEESRVAGLIPDNLNSTYLTLIPKVYIPSSFVEYRSIALSNLFYKLITKIIAER